MKFGIMFANAGPWSQPDNAGAMAEAAEATGIESLWTVEHVVVPKGYRSAYPYSKSGRMPGGEDTPIPDPLIWLSWMAARTTRVRLCTGVLILPQRPPAVTAKEVATLDVLSGGRVSLGVGVGWLAEEFAVLGVPFEERGPRTDEAIEALRAFWTQDEPTYHGRYYNFDGAISLPHPVQPGGVPIVVGGHTKSAARRAGRLGDGFFPAQGGLDVLPGLLDVMRAAAKDAGRDPDAIEITSGGSQEPEVIKRFADLGVDRMIIPPPAFDPAGLQAGLERFAEEVMAKV
jgi:probable F420-dependent oxidoreductase